MKISLIHRLRWLCIFYYLKKKWICCYKALRKRKKVANIFNSFDYSEEFWKDPPQIRILTTGILLEVNNIKSTLTFLWQGENTLCVKERMWYDVDHVTHINRLTSPFPLNCEPVSPLKEILIIASIGNEICNFPLQLLKMQKILAVWQVKWL